MNIIIPIAVVFYFGGATSIHTMTEGAKEILAVSVPFFTDIVKQEIENYLTSPYFITCIILNVFAVFGIWLGRRKSKVLFGVISIVLAVINAFPIICILFKN